MRSTATDVAANQMDQLPWSRHFAELGPRFSAAVQPQAVKQPRLLHVNAALAEDLGIDAELSRSGDFLAVMAGNHCVGEAYAATVYSGHQFGVYVPQLGDGRAMIIGELRDRHDQDQELQLKGCGQTPWSRFADGRAVLRSSLREYLCSEAMHGLGIPTTRALCLINSETPVQREQWETAALVCRVSPSHIRFGHFEYFSHNNQKDALRQLVDFVIARHWPQLADAPDRLPRWLEDVLRRTARLMAQWQCVGFCHGVMNTDNFSILGLTIDYGPFGFMDHFDAHHICNHSDHEGRYAYDRQPSIGHWNCMRLLQAMLPLLAEDEAAAVDIANDLLRHYASTYSDTAIALWRAKLGLLDSHDGDAELINRLLQWMHACRADFSRCFRMLSTVEKAGGRPALLDEVIDPAGLEAWLDDYRTRLRAEARDDRDRAKAMNSVNPKYVLRNWIAQEAIDHADTPGHLDRLMHVLANPYDEHPEHERWFAPPPDWAAGLSVSCSS
jgi:uncharacterized protein YdiU (UPF0061 family)